MMIGRRAVVGLALLLALLCSAFVAQSASAVVAKNTTAFTCVKEGGGEDFKDAHCDEKVGPEAGEYGHVPIPVNETTKAVVTNAKTKNSTTESTPGILKGTLAGVTMEIICNTITGEGTFTNEEPESKVHTGKGSGTTKFTACTVVKPAKCAVKEPIEVSAEGVPVEGLGAGGNEMGGELKPPGGGKTFVSITLENKGLEKCSLAGKPFNVEGTAIATSTPAPTEKYSGATAVLTNAMTKETLTIGGKPAEISATTTVRRAPVEGKEQNPIASTTVT
jgi:hypothetical protein